MSLIKAGEFLMGSPDGEGDREEHPRHKVWLDAYYLDKYEVTVAEYAGYAAAVGIKMPEQPDYSRADHPVVYVTWNDADAYCRWRGKRLPTEAEWEKAVRCGTRTKWPFGNEQSVLGDYAWSTDNSNERSHPVGQKKPNPCGLYDMEGNVWEWVSDWYADYSAASVRNPKGPDTGEYKIWRGGSWYFTIDATRSAHRQTSLPGFSVGLALVGFRCAL